MMDASTYQARRDAVSRSVGGAPALIMGHFPFPRNYPDNVFPFRQNSHVLYLCGLARPNLALALIGDRHVLFGPPEDLDDVVWHGPHETLNEAAAKAGLSEVRPFAELGAAIKEWGSGDVHYLSPHQFEVRLHLASLLGVAPSKVGEHASKALMKGICELRLKKLPEEIAEMEDALRVTKAMHLASMAATKSGVTEAEVAAEVQRVALAEDRAQAYNPIITVHGEVLHNNHYHNRLEEGQLLLNDSGAESPMYYASDITRTAPVSGRFSTRQREIYDVVLDAQLRGIAAVSPGTPNKTVHMEASHAIAEGLTGLGLMKGDPKESVAAGAHALFFPHGIGHMIGLDVHDMEDLGDVVGYGEGESRSDQFGLNFLRLARPLEEGHVVTVEPGIYFIPALIDRWEADGKHKEFIAYDRLGDYRNFGGIRIEDDVLCTADGHRVLGPPIPKTAEDVERATGA